MNLLRPKEPDVVRRRFVRHPIPRALVTYHREPDHLGLLATSSVGWVVHHRLGHLGLPYQAVDHHRDHQAGWGGNQPDPHPHLVHRGHLPQHHPAEVAPSVAGVWKVRRS